jgi:hypothetical protein
MPRLNDLLRYGRARASGTDAPRPAAGPLVCVVSPEDRTHVSREAVAERFGVEAEGVTLLVFPGPRVQHHDGDVARGIAAALAKTRATEVLLLVPESSEWRATPIGIPGPAVQGESFATARDLARHSLQQLRACPWILPSVEIGAAVLSVSGVPEVVELPAAAPGPVGFAGHSAGAHGSGAHGSGVHGSGVHGAGPVSLFGGSGAVGGASHPGLAGGSPASAYTPGPVASGPVSLFGAAGPVGDLGRDGPSLPRPPALSPAGGWGVAGPVSLPGSLSSERASLVSAAASFETTPVTSILGNRAPEMPSVGALPPAPKLDAISFVPPPPLVPPPSLVAPPAPVAPTLVPSPAPIRFDAPPLASFDPPPRAPEPAARTSPRQDPPRAESVPAFEPPRLPRRSVSESIGEPPPAPKQRSAPPPKTQLPPPPPPPPPPAPDSSGAGDGNAGQPGATRKSGGSDDPFARAEQILERLRKERRNR